MSKWSSDEQSGTATAADETMHALAVANGQYEEKFGHVFLICATGKSADEILASCLVRLQNDADAELRNAAEEQRKITHLRLVKLVM